MKRSRFKGALFAFTALLGAGCFVACGGGGGGGSPGAPGQPVPMTASPCPSGYQGTSPNCVQVASLTGQFMPIAVPTATALPALSGYGGTIYIPAANPASAVQMQLSMSNPSSVAFSLVRRAKTVRIAAATNTALVYISLAPSPGPVTFTGNPGFPGFQITLPSNGSAGDGPFYLAQLQGSVWTTVAGPATSSGGAVTLQPNLPVLSLPPTAYFVLYTGGVVPSVAPSNSPGGQPTSTASSGTTPTPPSAPTSSTSPVSSPTSGASIPPTPTSTATPTPNPFPTAPATPTPTPGSGTQVTPASLVFGALPSVTAGPPIPNGQYVLPLTVYNSSNQQISGSYPAGDAVTVSSNDTTGAVKLSLNGGTPAATIVLTTSSQLAFLVYSGAAVNPVTITASAATAPSATANFAPVIQDIAYTPPVNVPSTCSDICLYAPLGGGAGSTYTFTATQAGYTGSFGNTLVLTGVSTCSAFATVVQSGTTFTVNSIASPTPGTCNVVIHGFGTTSLTVTISYTTFGVTLQ